jgi:hypothetical protein
VKILFAGIIARYPLGGVTWCSLMYLLGLRALGHDVFYIEDTGECVYDPVLNTRSEDPRYGTTYLNAVLEPYGLGDRWTFVNYDGTYHGQSAETVARFCRDADLFLNLSGGSWFWRDEYARIPRSAFIDSDPAFTQLSIAKAEPWYVEFFQRFSCLFTFGSNIGTARSPIPVGDFTWHKTWQPITLDDWRPVVPAGDQFTTVMTWRIDSFTDVGGNKDEEFMNFLDLPSRTSQPLELAVSRAPRDLLHDHGWATVDAMEISRSISDYRQFIHRSRAEFGIAKRTYVQSRSGWFSDRTECYLASGRPALVQDTGWTDHLPSGEGLLAFSSIEQAIDGIDRINSDYPRHARQAIEIVREHFDANRVLPKLLEIAAR